MKKSFRTPYGTKITLIGKESEVKDLLKKCLETNKIIIQIKKLEEKLLK